MSDKTMLEELAELLISAVVVAIVYAIYVFFMSLAVAMVGYAFIDGYSFNIMHGIAAATASIILRILF